MKLKNVKSLYHGRILHGYGLDYCTCSGQKKTYEIVSRNPDITDGQSVRHQNASGVVIIATDEEDERILLLKEFRLSVNSWVYNFPCGLIDPPEMPEDAARRELKEETGLFLTKVKKMLPKSYDAVGLSNESSVIVIGTASGMIEPCAFPFEEIEAGWYTRNEVEELLDYGAFSARTQMYCHLWAMQA